jgi:two-component system, cell cycle sensor histidine kinase and response regulator CckA
MSHSKEVPLAASQASALNAPDQLNENEVSFRFLFMNHPQPMWVYDVETLRFLAVNEAAISHYGYSRNEFLCMQVTDIGPQETAPDLLEHTDLAQSAPQYDKKQYDKKWKHRLKDGRLIDVEVGAHRLSFGGREAGLAMVRDITQQTQAERKYQLIFEEAIIGICQTTPDGRLLNANPAMAQMLGYDSAEELLQAVNDVGTQLYVDPERRREFKRLVEREDVVRHFECEVYRKDGGRLWLSANGRAVREGDTVVRYEGTFEDISDVKRLEGQLRHSQRMEAVGRLAGGVAHDFNNALGVIMGYGELLRTRLPDDGPLRRYTEEIAKAAQRAGALTRQLLAFSRKQVMHPVVLDLNVVITEAEKMVRRLIGEDIEITFTPDPELGWVKMDQGQMEQILMNLAINARDAMPTGGKISIGTSNVALDEVWKRQYSYVVPGSYVMLTVTDTGCGIDKEIIAHIFEPFFTTKEPGKGTGLGLSTVYGIVKQNNGYIWASSEPGRGSTFKICLPMIRAAGLHYPAPVVEFLPDGSETILIVEDEAALLALARSSLERKGYQVLHAPNSAVAIEVAKSHQQPIHLLLTDVVMPGLSGPELAGKMTELQPDIKVLYMSGYTNDLLAHYGVLDEGIMLLEKPFTLHALLKKVAQVLHPQAAGN